MNTSKIKQLVFAIVALAVLLPLKGLSATLTIEDFTIKAGETKTMLVDVNNSDMEVTMVEFYMLLPQGLSVPVEDDLFEVDIAGRTTLRKHSIEASMSDGLIHVLLYSSKNYTLEGTNGAAISVKLTADATFTGGDITFVKQLITAPDENESKPADYTYKVTTGVVQDNVTLTAKSYTRQYGEDNPTFGYDVTSGTIMSGMPTLTCSATKTSPVGTYPIVISKGSVSNSTVNLVNGTLTITKAPLTISAGNYTKVEGEQNPTFSPTFSGFKNGETKSVLTKQPTVTTTATTSSPAGTYPVTVSGAEAQNYDFAYIEGTLTVTAKPVVGDNITFADANVKAICVENWDINGDGELSKAEAAAVTSLGQVFKSKRDITSFNELQYFTGLTTIDDNAFQYCRNLTSVVLPGSLTTIGGSAFQSCEKLVSANIPGSVTEIGIYAFMWCYDLGAIDIPSSVKTIKSCAFRGCRSLKKLTIPGSVTQISYGITSYCDSLASIVVESGNPNYDSRDNCNAIITKSSNSLIAGCKNTVIPSSVTSIGYEAFEGNGGLEVIVIPKGVKSIGQDAFAGCYALTSVKVESGNTVYDSRGDCNAIIETATNELVAGCKTTVIPNTVTSLRQHAFYQCKDMESITIPGSVNTIGANCFDDCDKLAAINFSEGLETVGRAAFQSCDALTSVSFPNSLKTIEPWAFNACKSLASITIPASVTAIGEKAFYQITNIKEVTSGIKEPFAIADDVFQTSYSSGKFTDATLYVPAGTKSKYEATDGWKNFTTIVEGGSVVPTPDIVRNVVMEETSGTWCGWCVRGFVAMKQAREEFGDRFIGISVHAGDVMSLDRYYDLGIDSYPSCCIDRDDGIYDPSYLYVVRNRMNVVPTVGVSVKGEWNADKTMVTATSETQFLADGDGYSVAYVLVADGLTGTSSRWNQNNAYSGSSSSDPDLQAYCEKGNPITDMVYNDVMVGSSYSSSGVNLAGSFGGAMKKGDKRSNSYTLSLAATGELAAAIDKNQVYVVAIVTNPDGTIANAAKAKVGGKAGDVNGDNTVDVADIASVISVMASSAGPQSGTAPNTADVNGDGTVDVADIATIISIMAANVRELKN